MSESNIGALIRTASIIDLSLTLAEGLPCYWPGAIRYRHTTDHWFADVEERPSLREWSSNPYHACTLELDEHTGTHFDAPAHFIPPPGSGLPNAGPAGSITTEFVELRQLIGSAVVIDVSSLLGVAANGVSPRIEPDLLDHFERDHGAVREGEIVLFRSGWDQHYQSGPAGRAYVYAPLIERSEPAWPAPSPDAIGWLLERGVRCVGTDSVSMGPAEDGVPTHLVGLAAGMVYIEALANLGAVPTRGATFVFLPLRIAGGTGGPGRALAII